MMNKKPIDNRFGESGTLTDFITKHILQQLKPSNLVDFGAGGGKIGKITRSALSDDVYLIAVEGDKRTFDMLSSITLYNKVYHSLIQEWLIKDKDNYDIAIFGDVLEHLKPKEVHWVIKKCLNKFKHIILIVPLWDLFQDDAHGNPLEIHQTYITKRFFDRYNIIAKHIIKGDEVTYMNIHISTEIISESKVVMLSNFIFHRLMRLLQPIGLAKPLVNLLKRYFLKQKWLIGRDKIGNREENFHK